MAKNTVDQLFPAIDRLQEAHFFLHGLEEFYHFANQFRWHLNAFLRALSEVPKRIETEFQNRSGFAAWHRGRSGELRSNQVIRTLGKQRDFIVHHGMLKPLSQAFVGVTEGRGMKLGLGLPFDPLSDSDAAMRNYLAVVQERGDFLGILGEDEDSLPAIERRWRLKEFGDSDVVEVCANAWHLVGRYVNDVASQLADSLRVPELDCRHDLEKVRIRAYDRERLRNGVVRGFPLS
jgi:hypothetical protein